MAVTKLGFSYNYLKLKLRVYLTGYSVTMVTCYIMIMIITCSTINHLKAIGHMTHLRNMAIPYTCAQPYHPSSGSHGQLFRPY